MCLQFLQRRISNMENSGRIRLHMPQLEGRPMYHYTTENALIGILREEKIVLRLKNADYFDDTTEGKEIYRHLRTACRRLLKEGRITSEQCQQITKLEDTETYPLQYPTMLLDDKRSGYIEGHNNCTAYVMSFCKEPDNEYMWEKYAKQECCLHFNRDGLNWWFPSNIECFKEIREVTYTDKDKVDEIYDLILNSLSYDDYLQNIRDGLSINRYFYKKWCPYRKESEMRLLFAIPQCTRKTTYVEEEFHSYPSIKVEIDPKNELFMINGVTLADNANYKRVAKHLQATNHPLVRIQRKGSASAAEYVYCEIQ